MTKPKRRRQALEALNKTRAQHGRALQKLEKARGRVKKRTRQLRQLEARLFALEQQARAPETARLGQALVGDHGLRRARLIVNPTAGGIDGDAAKISEIVQRLRAHGILAELSLKTSGKAARVLAKEAADAGLDLVIAAGGDGTIEDVALALINHDTDLGILPVGTSNNLARSLGIPLGLEDACTLLGMGVTRLIDVGRVTPEAGDSELFLETAGVGLTSIIIPAGQALRKRRWSKVSHFVSKVFDVHGDPLALELASGEMVPVQSQLVTVSNAPLGAINVLLAPEARMDDGLLDVTVYEDMSRAELLAYFLAASHGHPARDPKVRTYRVERVTIRAPQPIAAHADKNALPEARAYTFEAVPKSLRIIAGQGLALTIPVEAVPAVPPLAGKPKDDDQRENGDRPVAPSP